MCVQELPFEFLAGCLRPIAAFSTFVAAARDVYKRQAEGLQTMRVLARNMAQLLKAGVGPRLAPEPEEREWTHFIR